MRSRLVLAVRIQHPELPHPAQKLVKTRLAGAGGFIGSEQHAGNIPGLHGFTKHQPYQGESAMPDDTVTVQKTIDAPASEVWAALTTPSTIKKYFFGSDVRSDFRRGSPITWSGEHEGKHYEDKGEIQALDPGKSMTFTHYSTMSGKPDKPENYATVTYGLEKKGDKTEVTVTQQNCMGHEEQTRKNWAMVLDGLKKTVEH